jgi:hypothetical protein
MHLSQWFLALIDGAKSVIQAGGASGVVRFGLVAL